MQLALERSAHAWTNAHALGSKCRNGREKAAWDDCVKLYADTMLKLNQSVAPNIKCISEDIQTWLSTTLTNLETCKEGFIELGVTDNVMPLISDDVLDKLISNSLAINIGFCNGAKYKHEFPTWIFPDDRKLLQSSSLQLLNQMLWSHKMAQETIKRLRMLSP